MELYEYLDHPADVIVHSVGRTFSAALEQAVLGMFNFMTPLEDIDENGGETVDVDIEGADEKDTVYHLMDEFLFQFCTELITCKVVKIISEEHKQTGEIRIKAHGQGERFVRGKHEQGTEIKAITMHNLRIERPAPDRVDIFVTLDI